MKLFSIYLLVAFSGLFSVALGQESKEAGAPNEFDDRDWPQVFGTLSGLVVTIYQPQVEEWPEYRHMVVRAAVTVAPDKAEPEQITYGALTMEADTTVDKENRAVFFGDRTIKSLTFPNAADEVEANRCRKAVESVLTPTRPLTVNLDRILANAERAQQQSRVVGISVEAPPIFFSSDPAILVIFLGPPKFEKIEGSTLFFGANTNWDVFLDPSTSSYYLLNGEGWLTSKDVMKGPWTATTALPAGLGKLPANDAWKAVLAALPAKAVAAPKVFVSDRPAELVLTDGSPQIEAIPGTRILTLANSESDVFLFEGSYYFLTAGRWFKAKEPRGPWESAMDSIPGEFAKIPGDSKKAHVLSSVPGTPDAQEALIMASVPQTAEVKRDDATLEVKYEGEPTFVAIKDTTVEYASNTPNDVFRVDAKYYCCEKGVWFVAAAPNGPWAVCADVPDAIYTIPASSPQHNVTYVYVYDSDPETVTVGYTSGYSGAYVLGDLLVFGAGLWLASEILDDWDDHWRYCNWHYHPSHWSYGCGARYNPYYGGYYRVAHHSYGPYGGAGRGAVYNPWTGGFARGGQVYGPRGAAFAREGYNPWTDTYGARVGASTPYGSWGRSVVTRGDEWARAGHRSGARGSVGGIQGSEGGAAIKVDRRFGSDAFVGRTKDDDLYVGKDGNVYRRDSDGDWSGLNRDGWNDIERPSGERPTPYGSNPDGTRSAVRRDQAAQRPAQPATRPTQPATRPTQPARPTQRPTEPTARPTQRPVQPSVRPTPQRQQRTVPSQLQRDSQARSRGTTRTTQSRSFSRGSSGSGGRRGR